MYVAGCPPCDCGACLARLVLACGTLLPVSTERAQPLTRCDVGTRIRIATIAADAFQGTVVALARDTLHLAVVGVGPPLDSAIASLRTIAHAESVDRGGEALLGRRN